MAMGSWPEIMLMREGAQSGEGQYAESNCTAFAASLSRLGVWICESGLYIFSNGAES